MAIIPFRVEEAGGPAGVRIISVRGELDLETAPDLERVLEAATAEKDARILIDLSDCEFMDSTGVALIVRAWQRHDGAGGNGGAGRLVLCCPTSQVKRLLEVTGVGGAIPTTDDRDEAIAQLTG